MTRTGLALVLTFAAALPGAAQTPGAPLVVNGRLDARPGGDIAAAVRALPGGASDVAWIGYSVPAEGEHDRCCWNKLADGGAGRWGCALERGGPVAVGAADAVAAARPVPLEPASTAAVLVRVAAGAIDRIRVFSPTCTVDAGQRTLHWLSSVTPDASATWLQAQVASASASRRLADDALMALAAHAAPRALDYLLTDARSGSTPHVRSQALFWLSQRAGDRAAGAITEAIDQDPDTDVKRKAVFALSQLPAAEGVPRLIEVARAHSNPAVRKQAFFWLGQSKDPRALAFFADVLKR